MITWFFNLPLDVYIDNTKAQSLNFESKTHEAQLVDQKSKKSLRRSYRRKKIRKANRWHEKRQTKEKVQEKLKLKIPSETNS
jgi:hypothetical protein